ncbi:GNAT family N-acetyltransferase [Nitratireductor sp. GCM10026969]
MAEKALSLPAGYRIRAYARTDAAVLAEVEARASVLFGRFGFPSLVPDSPMEAAEFHALATEGETLVASERSGSPVGYAVTRQIAGFLHLRELAVDPAHGRRGVGRALLMKVIAVSAERKLDGVSLSTFRALPFNEGFYARHGFLACPLNTAPACLAEQFAAEVPPGIPPETRLLMLRRNGKSL